MSRLALLFASLAILSCPSAGLERDGAGRSSLTLTGAEGKNRPVTKVINLLKDMLKQLEKEAEEDQEIYDKLACWCETNDKEKTKAIADAQAKITDLTSKIEEYTATSSRLGTEIKNLEQEVAKNQEALDKATAIREKQLSEFNAEEKDLLESISALKSAVTVLDKNQGGSLLQIPRSHIEGVAAMVQHEMQRHALLLRGVLSPSARRILESFVQAPQDALEAPHLQAYQPQSGEIFGILKQMKDSFESNLADSQKEEANNQKAYDDLKAAKEEEIKAGQTQIDTKTQEIATTDGKKAHAKEDMEDTKASLSADEEFLAMLKEKCSMTDKEWDERQKTRQLEMGAVSKALSVLGSDDAHDQFSKSFNAALLQKSGKTQAKLRLEASEVLFAAAKKLHNPHLSTLAYRVRLDAFTKVKKAIDDMIATLGKQKADEIKHKDFCVEEFNTNAVQTEKKTREKKGLTAKIEDLEMSIKTLADELKVLKDEITEMQVQMKRAGEDRQIENKEFQEAITEQRETQKLLNQALNSLTEFYGDAGKSASLVQGQQPAGPPPPAGFKEYKKNGASSGVMNLIQTIIDDSKAVEIEAIRDEEDAQKAYEEFVKDNNGSVDTKTAEIADKSEEKAKAEVNLVQSKEKKDAVMTELEELSTYNAQLHQSCDFVMKNFEVRQTARDEEVEALKQAKMILSGANFEEFLQSA